MIYTKSHFSWFLLNMRNFCVSFFFTKLSWSGYWRRHAERFQHWLTVVRDIFSPHLSQGRPENTHTAFKHQETSKHYHLVLSNKVQNYLILFSCHIFILRDICHIQIYYKLHNFEKAKWILKAFNCCFFAIFKMS